MSSHDFVSFDFVKKSVTIVQILDRYGITQSLRRKDDSLTGVCPFHGGSNKNAFRVSISKNCFNCFGQCKSGGNILDFVSKKEGVSIREAAKLIQDWFGLSSPQNSDAKAPKAAKVRERTEKQTESVEEPSTAPNPPLSFALKNLDPEHPFFAKHGFSPETVREFGAGYCAKGLMAGKIAVPIHNARGELVGYGGWPLESQEKEAEWVFPPKFNCGAELFNLHRAAKEPHQLPLIVVLDIWAVMSLWQLGLGKSIAVMSDFHNSVQGALFASARAWYEHVIVASNQTQCDNLVAAITQHAFTRSIAIRSTGAVPQSLPAETLEHLRSLDFW